MRWKKSIEDKFKETLKSHIKEGLQMGRGRQVKDVGLGSHEVIQTGRGETG